MKNAQTELDTSTSSMSEQEQIRAARRALRSQRRVQRRNALFATWSIIGVSALLLAFIGISYFQIEKVVNSPQPLYATINGVPCNNAEQIAYHIHVHITMYINGQRATIPQNIGIEPGAVCYYWLHTHTSDGIIHIEAPQKQSNLALDDFFTIWHNGFARLSYPSQANVNTGWKLYLNGKLFPNNGASPLHTEMPFSSHDVITLEYGTPNLPPDTIYVFPPSLPT